MSLKNLTAFALLVFCTLAGFLAAVSVFVYYGFWLQRDLPGNLTGMAYVFIGQSFGGAVGSLFARREAGSP